MSDPQPLLVVIGPPGAGKSRVGKQVARLLRVDFVDTDRRIVARHGPIPAIFAEHGEPWFRAAERAEVARALGERAVVSLGGGAVLDPETQAQLGNRRVALITVSPEAVRSRISGSVRPLLTDGVESWKTILEQRRDLYERLATRTWDSSHRSPSSLAHEIADWVRTGGEGT
jgi:shikimate kinase